MMRITALLLACLLLCGCGQSQPSQPDPAPAIAVSQERAVFAGREGDLETYRLPQEDAYALRPCFGGLLVLSGTGQTTLTLLSAQLEVLAQTRLDFFLDANSPALQIHPDHLSCYHPTQAQTLVLDPALEPVSQIAAPQGLVGTPLLSQDRRTLYYCTDNALRAWDLDSGIRRLVTTFSQPGTTVTGLLEGGSVIQCTQRQDAQTATIFLSAQTGQILRRLDAPVSLQTAADRFYARFPYGGIQALVFGTAQQPPQILLPEQPGAEGVFLPELSMAVTGCLLDSGRIQLTGWDLASGGQTPPLLLCGTPLSLAGLEGDVYLLTQQDSAVFLNRWAIRTEAGSGRIAPYVTADHPDEAGLAQCRQLAQQIGQTYGLEVRIGPEAAAVQPWDYVFQPEEQPAVLLRELELLDQRLARYPASVLADTIAHFSCLRICMVHSLSGSGPEGLHQANGLQFLQDGDAYLILAIGRYSDRALYHEMYHVMQTHILTQSSGLDRWESLNPQDFSYDYSYTASSQSQPSVYLATGSRAFIDRYSMTFPKEDQARILEYAMLPGQQALFQAPALQQKLSTLCQAIREAYRLQDYPEPLLWEQYLH